jgi:hypothetical protein
MKNLFYFIITSFVGTFLILAGSKNSYAAHSKTKPTATFVEKKQVAAQDSTTVIVFYIRQEEYKKDKNQRKAIQDNAVKTEKKQQDKENKSYQMPSYQIEKPNILQAITNWIFKVLENVLLPSLIK